jgi:hypothetical protein
MIVANPATWVGNDGPHLGCGSEVEKKHRHIAPPKLQNQTNNTICSKNCKLQAAAKVQTSASEHGYNIGVSGRLTIVPVFSSSDLLRFVR